MKQIILCKVSPYVENAFLNNQIIFASKISATVAKKEEWLIFNFNPTLLNADAWHNKSSENNSKNGTRFPPRGSTQVLFLAR